MRQFGAAAGSALAEIALLEEQHVVSPAGGIDGNANPGSAAAHHNHVPGTAMLPDTFPDFGSIHFLMPNVVN
jgi:hypothetical protein